MLNGKVTKENGSVVWYKDDKLHREDGPAVDRQDGHKEWWLNGERHRDDGPAIENHSGEKYWYIDGVHLPEKECKNQTSSKKESIIPSTKQQMFSIYAENNLQHLLDENGIQLNETGTHYKNSKLNEHYLNFCKTVDMVLDHTNSLKRKRLFVIASKLKEKIEDFNRYQFSEKPSAHLSYGKAFTEARRLGVKFPDKKFYIFQRVMKVV
jgi:hypothetical protein